MAGIRSQFAGQNLEFEEFIKLTGTFDISQLPNRYASMVRFKTFKANNGSIFLGNVYNTGSVLSLPFEMGAGEDTGWFSTDNLNRYYMGGASGSCYMGVWLQK